MAPGDVLEPGRVLLVDDDAAMTDLLVHALVRHGLIVRAANTVAEAVAVVRELDPHVAVLDLHLGGASPEDGHDLGIRLLAESARRLQLIVLTADGGFAAHARTETLGFAAHLVKPAQLRDVVRLIEMLVPRARETEG